MEFNINGWVKVKLTQKGLDELERQHHELCDRSPGLSRNFTQPVTDGDGYSTWLMWSLMYTFGHMCGLGQEVPFVVIKVG